MINKMYQIPVNAGWKLRVCVVVVVAVVHFSFFIQLRMQRSPFVTDHFVPFLLYRVAYNGRETLPSKLIPT
jgi:hypothetical protein